MFAHVIGSSLRLGFERWFVTIQRFIKYIYIYNICTFDYVYYTWYSGVVHVYPSHWPLMHREENQSAGSAEGQGKQSPCETCDECCSEENWLRIDTQCSSPVPVKGSWGQLDSRVSTSFLCLLMFALFFLDVFCVSTRFYLTELVGTGRSELYFAVRGEILLRSQRKGFGRLSQAPAEGASPPGGISCRVRVFANDSREW